MVNVRLGNLEVDVTRPKLKVWLRLQDIREKITNGDKDNLVLSLLSYVSEAVSVPVKELENLPWFQILHTYDSIVEMCNPTMDFPILKARPKENKEEVWEYEGRTWYMWANTLATAYGWTLEYIAELDIDDAIGLMQEIYTEEQLEREWEWSRSEIAYPYNAHTKKTDYKPLPRPSWMSGIKDVIIEKVKKIPINPAYLPVGKGIKWNQ